MFWRSASFAVGIVVASSIAGGIASAAEFKSATLKDGRVVISITGEISAGDTDALKAGIKAANDVGKLVTSIRLNSGGGNLLEGVQLAEAIKFAKMATNVGQGATCASACFLIFAAGESKFANYSAKIGVHGASDKGGEETVRSGAATVSMARIAKELGVPSSIIGRMVVTPPSEMVWLSPADLQSMGATMVGKPSQIAQQGDTQTIRQTAPGSSIEITSQTKATTSPQPTWNEYVEAAISLSAKQNGGKPRTTRGCQPEIKLCFNAVSYLDDKGVETGVKVIKDMNDKIVAKEVCTFN